MNQKRTGRLLALAVVLTITTIMIGCSGGKGRYIGRSGGRDYPLSGKSYVINGKRYHILASARGYWEEGEASWYGRDFHGRKTAGGEAYNMHALTAAHKTLPLNTWVKVTNLTNNRVVTVRVNDRGPFARGRIIDLSYAAAKDLGMVAAGVAPVRIEALGAMREMDVAGRQTAVLVQPESYSSGRFAVQVGSFKDKDNARALADRLRREFGKADVSSYDRGGELYYRVRVADVSSTNDAAKVRARLEGLGFNDCFVVAR